MKTLRLFSMLMLLMAASGMAAQDRYIYAAPVTIEAGGEAEIVVKMDLDTEEAIGQFGFVMKMPEGITTTYTQSRYVKRSVTVTAELEGEEDNSVIQAFLDPTMV